MERVINGYAGARTEAAARVPPHRQLLLLCARLPRVIYPHSERLALEQKEQSHDREPHPER
ncbi:hypothetical protein, partial [Arthrobacter agilis]|uniref:hypothetical protein n=1 Tax=Arthrobacter agilis TaxID=37921 RepID=UPI001ABFCDCD